MNTNDSLPLDLTWQSDGHASEIALTMLADGEGALLVDGVERHVETCEACSIRLGQAALLSLRATEELPAITNAIAATSPVLAPSPLALRPLARPFPVRAILAALAIAVVGVIPTLLAGLPRLPDFTKAAVRMLPLLGRTAISLVKGGAGRPLGITPAASWLAACLFLVAGVALARTMSRARSIQGEVR